MKDKLKGLADKGWKQAIWIVTSAIGLILIILIGLAFMMAKGGHGGRGGRSII